MMYEGDFIDGTRRVKHGKGVMRWYDGREYRGQFSFDKLHGEGIMTWPTGAKYVGQYCDNYKGGMGKLTLPDGTSFEGNWHRGRRHGEFLYHSSQAGTYALTYENDVMVASKMLDQLARWTFKSHYNVFIKDSDEVGCSDSTCCICLNELDKGDTCSRTCCKHVFHKECLDGWMRREQRCPLCREKITPSLHISHESGNIDEAALRNFSISLNAKQQEAVRRSVSTSLLLVQGPPANNSTPQQEPAQPSQASFSAQEAQ